SAAGSITLTLSAGTRTLWYRSADKGVNLEAWKSARFFVTATLAGAGASGDVTATGSLTFAGDLYARGVAVSGSAAFSQGCIYSETLQQSGSSTIACKKPLAGPIPAEPL